MKLFSSSKSLLIGGVCIAVACSMIMSCSGGPDHTPSQIVQRWISVYPKDLAQAATITSWGMRDGLSPEKWIDKIKTLSADFSYVEGRVVSEEITKDDKAKVIVDAKITSVLGEQTQREQFKLSIVENKWMIDDRSVVMVMPNVPEFE